MRSRFAVVFLFALSACRSEEPQGQAPPPPPKTSPCAAVTSSPVAGLPARAADHCIDPGTDVRSYGVGTVAPLDQVCVELFNGECEVYRSYGLERVRTLAYAPDRASSNRINVVVSEFRSVEGAYGFYTRRVLGGDHPSQATVVELQVQGRAALGSGVAYVQRGRRVVELTYISETETPQEIEKLGGHVLTLLSRELGKGLGGEVELPETARLVDLSGVDPLGIELGAEALFGVQGTGPYAVAHFSAAEVPHRVIAARGSDDDAAEDLLRLLRRSAEGRKLKGTNISRLTVARPGRPPEVWFVTLRGNTLFGVGPSLLGSESPASEKERKAADARWKTFAVQRLKQLRSGA